MTVETQKEFCDHVSEVLRRVEAGEVLTVTVAGRPMAELSPIRRGHWIAGPSLANIWRSPAPESLAADLDEFGATLVDPYLDPDVE